MTRRERTSRAESAVNPTKVRAVRLMQKREDSKNSPAPPNTGHFGEFERIPAEKPLPEVEAVKQVAEIANSNPDEKIHHRHQVVAQSGDLLENGNKASGDRDVTALAVKAWGEPSVSFTETYPALRSRRVVNRRVSSTPTPKLLSRRRSPATSTAVR